MTMVTETVEDLDWPAMLHSAVDGCGIRAVYQPIVELTSGAVAGYEALIRFVGYPVRSPTPWLRAADEHGRGAELQAAALRAALDDRASLPPGCFLAVNVAPAVLPHPAIRRVWADQADLHGLVVELTEPVTVENCAALGPDLNQLRAAGARIAIDDAGPGHTGLTQLLALRPALIKLDRALVRDIDHDEAKRALVEMLGTFAHRIEARLLAEGVERPGELETPRRPARTAGPGLPPRPPRPATRSGLRGPHEHTPPRSGTISRVTSSPAAAQRLRDLAWLRRVRDRIDREYAQPLDVEALARGANMSAGHLSREFRRAYGESPYAYLMTRRIERAMALLRRGDLSVTDVCFTVGCSSLGTFSTRFTELVGVPPSTFRAQSARSTAGIPSCVAKQVTRPIRNREARATEVT